MAIRIILALAALLLLAACNKAGDSASTASTQSETAPLSASADSATSATDGQASSGEQAQVDETQVVGTTLALANGSSVTVEKISVVDSAPKEHAGLIAVAGHVEEVHADKGVFMISDPKDAACAEGGEKAEENCPCCVAGSVPIKLALENYEGSLPSAEQAVVVVGELSPTETGYTFVVHEVRSGEEVLLSLKASAEAPTSEGSSNA